tara:strand:+ start:88 stop:474 length:387 start_codon:yes stop_codon:yes gene_type:complete
VKIVKVEELVSDHAISEIVIRLLKTEYYKTYSNVRYAVDEKLNYLPINIQIVINIIKSKEMFNEVLATETRTYKDYEMILNAGVQTIEAIVYSHKDDFEYTQRFMVEGGFDEVYDILCNRIDNNLLKE